MIDTTTIDANAAVLLIGHGTHDAAGQREFALVRSQLALRLAPRAVDGAFLEINQPDIASGIKRMVAAGATKILVAPLLLFAAGHAKRDLPKALADARRRWPHVVIHQAEHLGNHRSIVELSHRRYVEACKTSGLALEEANEECRLLLVGRGSHEPSAREEMQQFCALRTARSQRASAEFAFVAMALPGMNEAFERRRDDRLIVQPHFLFSGVLVDRIRAAAAHAPSGTKQDRWIVAEPLGPHPLVVDAIVARLAAVAGNTTANTPDERLAADSTANAAVDGATERFERENRRASGSNSDLAAAGADG